LHGHPQHRQHGLCRDHAREVSGPAGARDDELQSSPLRAGRVLAHPLWCAMSRDDLALMRHAKLGERFGGGAHGVPIAFASHDDADERLSIVWHGGHLREVFAVCQQAPGRTFISTRLDLYAVGDVVARMGHDLVALGETLFHFGLKAVLQAQLYNLLVSDPLFNAEDGPVVANAK
jgi:hypothetical protein